MWKPRESGAFACAILLRMRLINWARGFYIAGMVAALVAFVPMAWFPLMPAKIALASVLMLVAAALWALASWKEPHPMPTAAWLFALVPLCYLVSWGFSADQAVGLVGTGIDSDTLLVVALCAAAGMLGAALFRSVSGASHLLRISFLAIVAAALFQAVVLIMGLPGPFADKTVNLIGKWNDLGILVLVVGALLLLDLEWGGLSRRSRYISWALGLVSLWLLAMINFSTLWVLLLVVAAAVGFLSWAKTRRIPWVPAGVAVVCAVFFFFGAPINAALSSVIPVTSLEVRPGLSSTFSIVTQTHGSSIKNTALGMGPNTFGLMWLAHKPAGVNQSQFWNLDFSVGYSTLLTAFGSVGVVGLLAWLAPFIGMLYLLWRGRGDAERRLVAWSLGLSAVLLWVMMALYVPSPNLLLLAFALAGGVVGLLGASGRTATRPMAVATVVFVLVALAWTGFASTRRSVAEAYVGQAAQALGAGDLAGAQSYTNASLAAERMPENLRLAVTVGGSQLTQLAAQPVSSSTQQIFTDTLSKTIAYGQEAITKDPLDYRSYLALGQVYGLLAQNKVEGAYDSAKAAYTAAAQRNPTNPTIPLLLARLEGAAGTAQGLTDALKQSLTLKPDYTDAILFLAQVDIARKDIASAINDTKVAAQTAPGVPSIWYELGLLYYANNDAKDAIAPLEQALTLQADYANAQYYLGLSYAAVGRTQDAIAQFTRLNQTNAGNAQVAQILANLEAGKAPLSTSTPAR